MARTKKVLALVPEKDAKAEKVPTAKKTKSDVNKNGHVRITCAVVLSVFQDAQSGLARGDIATRNKTTVSNVSAILNHTEWVVKNCTAEDPSFKYPEKVMKAVKSGSVEEVADAKK